MSKLLEDLSPQFSSYSPTKSLFSDRAATAMFRITDHKPKNIRPDSPTTIQACNELGFLHEDLKQKTIEDFRDPSVGEEVVQLRFNHYLKRYEQVIRDVTAAKRRIAKKKRIEQQQQDQIDQNQQSEQQQQQQSSPQSPKSPGANLGASWSSHKFMDTILCPPKSATGLRQSSLSPLISSAGHRHSGSIQASFNKTVYYLRSSHVSADTKGIDEVLGKIDDDYGLQADSTINSFHKTFSVEIDKYNKAKKYKQREARSIYEEEIRRVQVLQAMEEKHKRHEEKEKKLAAERNEKAEERRKMREAKLERIKELEKNFRMQKLAEKNKIREKLAEAQNKHLEGSEDKKKLLADKDKMLDARIKQVLERKQKIIEEEQRQCDITKEALNSRISSRQEQRKLYLSQKAIKMREMVDDIDEHIEKKKELGLLKVEADLNKIVDKLSKKESSVQNFKERHQKALKEREAESLERSKQLERTQQNKEQKYKEKVAEINEKTKRTQEIFEARKEAEEKQRKLKGEINRLKLHDKFENHARLERRTQFDRLKVLDKERHEHEKILWLKSHREIEQRTKLEVAVQFQVEKDKINTGVNHLKKLVYAANTTAIVPSNQKKILKAILVPEDYQSIEEEDRRRENERKAKLGLIEEPAALATNNMTQSQIRKKF